MIYPTCVIVLIIKLPPHSPVQWFTQNCTTAIPFAMIFPRPLSVNCNLFKMHFLALQLTHQNSAIFQLNWNHYIAWKQLSERIQYKIIKIAPFIETGLPAKTPSVSVSSSLKIVVSFHFLRSLNQSLLKICNRAFSSALPELWNAIPASLRSLRYCKTTSSELIYLIHALSPQSFRSELKTFIFQKSCIS